MDKMLYNILWILMDNIVESYDVKDCRKRIAGSSMNKCRGSAVQYVRNIVDSQCPPCKRKKL